MKKAIVYGLSILFLLTLINYVVKNPLPQKNDDAYKLTSENENLRYQLNQCKRLYKGM